VIGISRDQWKLLGAALVLGGNVRAGVEDNLYLPNGEMALNGELIAKARQMAEDIGRRAATVAGSRAAGVPKRERSPLSDVRVLDLTRLLPGASARCCWPTSAPGAEGRGHRMGDPIRWAPPYYGSEEQQALAPVLAHLSLNRSKRSIRLDLKSRPAGRRCCGWLNNTASFSTASARRPRPARGRLRTNAKPTRDCPVRDHRLRRPLRTARGHDMNYLGLVGLLG
jgi:hypothetical protein